MKPPSEEVGFTKVVSRKKVAKGHFFHAYRETTDGIIVALVLPLGDHRGSPVLTLANALSQVSFPHHTLSAPRGALYPNLISRWLTHVSLHGPSILYLFYDG